MPSRRLSKICEMRFRFGKSDGICKDCSNFRRICYRSKTYSKCKVYGISMSSSTDWNGKNQACGMFNKEYVGKPVYTLKHSKTEVKDERQMSLLDYTGGES